VPDLPSRSKKREKTQKPLFFFGGLAWAFSIYSYALEDNDEPYKILKRSGKTPSPYLKISGKMVIMKIRKQAVRR
jgi:hypothetical protein